MMSSVQESLSDCENTGQPEFARLAPKRVCLHFWVSVIVKSTYRARPGQKSPDLPLEFRSYLAQFKR